jgi:hypothetical protein
MNRGLFVFDTQFLFIVLPVVLKDDLQVLYCDCLV